MKNLFLTWFVLLNCTQAVFSQELFVFTEPASNMPAKSIGLRLTAESMQQTNGYKTRSVAEAMIGINKNWMVHLQGFASNMQSSFKPEGGSLYAKFRFLSMDDVHSHFRGAFFGRISASNQPIMSEDINLEGDNKGWQTGAVFTQLIHKLALSATVGYSQVFNSSLPAAAKIAPAQMLNYSLSSGYLLFPLVYKNYRQPNFNLYLEVLGKTNPNNGHTYIDVAPALQFIFNSRTRIDLGYRFQTTGNIENRFLKNMFLVKAEFNFFNVL